MNETDQQLIRRYQQERAEDAFAEIVRRHLNLVYSAALRQVQSPQLAKDVSQAVFTDLARSAGGLRKDSILSAWLYEVTRRTAIDVIRKEARRQLREQIYTEMNAINATSEEWRDVLPHLDAAMDELESVDRAAVLLRFFENKSLREVGEELGVSDDAARKRVARAVEQLREYMSKRGLAVGAAGLVVLISANAVQAAPGGLAAGITGAALAGAPVSAGIGAKILGAGLIQKVVVVVGLGVVAGAIIFATAHSTPRTKPAATAASLQTPAATTTTTPVATTAQENASATNGAGVNPAKLLASVMQARQRIHSGSAEFQYGVERYVHGRTETNQYRFVASFDESKLHFESFGKEYSYAFDEDEAKQNDIKKRADSMGHAAAVQAGLLEESTAHHTLVSDGTTVYDHYQSSHQRPGVSIRSIANSAAYLIDPRAIGLSIYFPKTFSAEGGLLDAKGAELVGEEDLDGIPAYHVRVKFENDAPWDYWLDKAHPERLLQLTYGKDVVKSSYDEKDLSDPIPVEVNTTSYRNGVLSDVSRLVSSTRNFNTRIDPESFTLAGMGLAVGTDVNDDRIYRRIGYWTGSGLSEDLPSRKSTEKPQAPQKMDELLAVLEREPASTNGLQAATWIILNTPDGPEVQQAADVIERNHLTDTNLVFFVQELNRARPSSAKMLLGTFLQNNPSVEVRGNACFTLATLWKAEAKFGQNTNATQQAIKNYERTINEFSSVKQRGYSLADLAKPELMELQKLTIGKPAPETDGVDLNGQPMKLSDYRGRVTVVVFWAGHFNEAMKFQKLAEDMAGKPFTLVGVNCDNKASRDEESIAKVNWPCFKDGRDGPISKLWNVTSWIDTWVLDREGVIRYRDVRDSNLRDAVNKLLEE